MGFTARKSFKIVPGVRMTVSKSGVSTSVGVPGARITRSSSGRTTTTAGVPGTGVRYTKSSGGTKKGNTKSKSSTQAVNAAPTSAVAKPSTKPGLMAPRWEKKLFTAMQTGDPDKVAEVARSWPDAQVAAALLEGMFAYQRQSYDRARELLTWLWSYPGSFESDRFVSKYMSASTLTLGVAAGVTATMPLTKDAVGLALAELLQGVGDLDGAIAVVEALEPSFISAVSLAELYSEAGRQEEVIDLTNEIANVDDPSALLLTLRGVAFRETHNYTAARAAFKEALKSSKRDPAIRRLAWLERARTYLAEGKKAMARKDLERILAETSDYPGLTELMEQAS